MHSQPHKPPVGILPRLPIRVLPTAMRRPLKIEVWTPNHVGIAWHVATVWSLTARRLAAEAVAPLCPDREVMLHQDCRVVAKREVTGETLRIFIKPWRSSLARYGVSHVCP